MDTGKLWRGAAFTTAIFLCLPSQATPIEIFGIRLFERADPVEVDLIDPLPYTVILNVTPDTRAVRRAVRRASNLIKGENRPALGRSGLLSNAKEDYARIVEALYQFGRYGSTVSILIEGREASDVPLNVSLPEEVDVRIVVDAGPVYSFGQTQVENAGQGLDTEDRGFTPGATAMSGVIGDVAIEAVDGWRSRGHAKADIGDVVVVADHASHTVDVRIDVSPGPRATYGNIIIRGSERIDPEFLNYMTDMRPGEPFNGEDVEAARRRIRKLDTFSAVSVEEADDISPDGSLDILVDVSDRKPRRLGAGVTISSLDGLGVEGFWLHRNLFGRAERLRFDAAVSRIGRSIDPNEFNWEVGANFLKPGVITPDTDYNLTLLADRELTENFDSRSVQASTGFATQITKSTTGEVQAILERSFTRDDLGSRDFITVGLKGKLAFDSRDDPLDATEGFYLALEGRTFYELEFENSGVRAALEGRTYRALDEDRRFVLAGRFKVGTLLGIDADEAPNSALFFSGGGGSVRGYAFRSNGVESGGSVSGGLSLIEASAELRADLTENWGVVGFLDAGIVGPGAAPDIGLDAKTAFGLGLRYDTGLGPIRFDIARGLQRDGDDPQLGFYVGLGQAF